MILVDSDIIISNLRGQEPARDWLVSARRETGPLSISVVTVAELRGGARPGEQHLIERALSAFRVLAIDHRTAVQAASFMNAYRRSHSNIGLGDYFIAATTALHELQLATLSTQHFPMFEGLTAPFKA